MPNQRTRTSVFFVFVAVCALSATCAFAGVVQSRLRNLQLSCPTSSSYTLQLSNRFLTDSSILEAAFNFNFDCRTQNALVTNLVVQAGQNQLSSLKFLQYITRDMKNLVSLQLYLGYNNFTSFSLDDFSSILLYTPLVTTLNVQLNNNKITDLYPLKFGFANMTQLTSLTLNFDSNNIVDLAFISTAFLPLTKLKELTFLIQENKGLSFISSLAFAFEKSTALTKLILDFSGCAIATVQPFATAFAKATAIQVFFLDLSNNKIVDVAPFETCLDNQAQLQEFTLYLNGNLINKGVDPLIDFLYIDVGSRNAFCPFTFYIYQNQLTTDQINRLNTLKSVLQTQADKATCATKSFNFATV